MNTLDAAKGKWRGILSELGVGEEFLKGPRHHGPCPLCGGTDRYRWDNRDGSGSYICGQCGAGTGMQLLQKLNGWDFKTAAAEVDRVIGNVRSDGPIKPPVSEAQRKRRLRDLYSQSKASQVDDAVGLYLAKRVGFLPACPDLRFHPSAPCPDGEKRPAMLAVVRDCATGAAVSIHRTFLTLAGTKADMPNPRAMMPGDLPEALSVRLSEAGETLGIAEGIETALAAQAKFGVPCHAALNAGFLAKWQPPEGVRRVIVFGDCDQTYTGQAAAYTLAHRLSRKLQVEVRIPGQFGTDWADEVAA